MSLNYFSEMLPVLAERAKYAASSYLRFANEPLTKHLGQMFDKPFGEPGAFLADPTFEAVFGWETGEKSMADLAGNLLSHDIINAMDAPPKEVAQEYRFAKDQKPYRHQIKSWEVLSSPDPQSIVVASGTGSGKTECFMVPILDSLARKRAQEKRKLTGVRALFLYPLNALINSQRERLRAWTATFDSDLRFCLYNGNTPDSLPISSLREHPSEVKDRKSLRKEPPPILVTNATMLEYMLVRTADSRIINESKGKLEWVVLDEAHSYIGSQAAEMALLIRRVLLAFDVRPENVRFVATSATIGDPDGAGGQQLKSFLSGISGVGLDRIHIVAGKREIPRLIDEDSSVDLSLEELQSIDSESEISEQRYRAICSNSIARRIRNLFVGEISSPSVAKLSAIPSLISAKNHGSSQNGSIDALKWLDLLSGTRNKPEKVDGVGEPFLPLRAHIFHRTFSGIWACADSNCTQKSGTSLDDPEWPFGLIFSEIRNHCACGSPVYEVVRCDGCGDPMLLAGIDGEGTVGHLVSQNLPDEFELENESVADNEDQDEDLDPPNRIDPQNRLLIVNKALDNVEAILVDRPSRKLTDSTENSLHIYGQEDGGSGFKCPSCGIKEGSKSRTFMSSRIGAPYFLGTILPTLLEYAPDGERPADSPCRGRRLLSFNDSRQGTARIATRLQQESERNRVRGLIYHLVLSGGGTALDGQIFEKAQLIENLRKAAASNPSDQLIKLIDEEGRKLKELSKPSSISFSDLATKIANSGMDFDRMLKYYRNVAGDTFQDRGSNELARMFLIREFGRRPKNGNSLETLGLTSIQYPALARLTEVNRSVQGVSDINLDEWKNLLKVCLDFFVRANGAVEINRDWRNWLGVPFPQSFLVGSEAEETGRYQKYWLKAKRRGRRSKFGTLLAYTLNANIDLPDDEDRVDIILRAIWDELCGIGLLSIRPEGRVLPLDQLSFSQTENAYICPVTRRVLDATFRGVTPYIPIEPRLETSRCESITMPIYDNPFSGTSDELERIRVGRSWLANNNIVANLRKRGIWSSFHDRVIELSLYFTTAEHSAQQDSATLERYEKRFKSGELNLLSCSTTMEMGIDIGGIGLVTMNNVPPHPANYLQRAGRAGRRSELRSTAMTLCKSNPHDLTVFSNSRWAFDTDLPAPKVSLDSPIIVQRHVNSFLLSHFLNEKLSNSGQESLKLTCDSFFLGESSLASRFPAWAISFIPSSESSIGRGIKELVRGSAFEGRSLMSIATEASDSMLNVTSKWLSEWNQLESDRVQILGEKDHEPVALKAIELHMSRLTGEYLLRELSSRGFLPAHGFPTNIASFDSMNVSKFKRLKNAEASGREDNRYRRREMASRDITTALREYAPGSEIVLDGLVYRSAGVTLNWHVPAEHSDVKEIQEIRFAVRCRKCGASDSSPSFEASQHCFECGNEIEKGDRIQYLEPAGFAVDFYEDVTNDITSQKYVPVEEPWINANGEWGLLPNPDLGRFRVTTKGHVFHRSSGLFGCGYAICLECGRAEPMIDVASTPPGFSKPHRKLRRSKDESIECPGSSKPWKIKKPLYLGSEGWTDVLELQLRSAQGVWLDDPIIANTICVALRNAIANEIGVQANELGCQIKQSRLETGGLCRSLLIFDRFAAGYSSGANRVLSDALRSARTRLRCTDNCDGACPRCVLDYDQRFAVDKLDRKAALNFLTESWIDSLMLPSNYRLFGQNTQLESHDIFQAIWNHMSQKGDGGIRLFTGLDKTEWDLGPSPLRELAYRIARKGSYVEIVIPGSLEELSEEDRNILASLSYHPHIDIRSASEQVGIKDGWVLAETIGEPSTRWAIDSAVGLSFSPGWGRTQGPTVRTNNGVPNHHIGDVLGAEQIRPANKAIGDREIEVFSDIDGPVSHFGKHFWNKICSEHDAVRLLIETGEDSIVECRYSDRYLFTPISVALVFSIIKGIKDMVGSARWDGALTTISTAKKQSGGDSWNSGKLWSDWQQDSVREIVIRELFQQSGIAQMTELKNNNEIEHGRFIDIVFSSGKRIKIRMDQGVGYWRVAQSSNRQLVQFDLNGKVGDQCSRISGLSVRVEGREMPTQMFITIR